MILIHGQHDDEACISVGKWDTGDFDRTLPYFPDEKRKVKMGHPHYYCRNTSVANSTSVATDVLRDNSMKNYV